MGMIWTFTGSQKGFPEETILEELKRLNLKKGDVVITGACVGIDAQIAHMVAKHYPEVQQIIIVPYVKHLPKKNQDKVDKSVFTLGKVFFMSWKDIYEKHPIKN